MAQTEDGKVITDGVSEEGQIVIEHNIATNQQFVLESDGDQVEGFKPIVPNRNRQ